MLIVAESAEAAVALIESVVRRVLREEAPRTKTADRNRSVREASKEAGVSVSTVRRRIKDGSVQTVRIGSRVVVPATEVERLKRPP